MGGEAVGDPRSGVVDGGVTDGGVTGTETLLTSAASASCGESTCCCPIIDAQAGADVGCRVKCSKSKLDVCVAPAVSAELLALLKSREVL